MSQESNYLISHYFVNFVTEYNVYKFLQRLHTMYDKSVQSILTRKYFVQNFAIMRLRHNEVKFDLTYESHQNTVKTYLMNVLRCFMIIKFDLKIDLIISKLHDINFIFLETSSIVNLFDILSSQFNFYTS